MKRLILALCLAAPLALLAEDILEMTKREDLPKQVDQKVILTGTYHNPGKGSRSVDCGFVRFGIQDYSFYTKSKEGFLTTTLKDGDRIRFVATITYFKGSKSLVATHPIKQERLPPIQVIDGKEYYVYPPSYGIREAELIEALASAKAD